MLGTNRQSYVFRHMIELTSSGCVFCHAQEENSGKARLFLIFKDKGKVYSRNGLRGIWEEIHSEDESLAVLEGFAKAIAERNVPCFSTVSNDLAYV